MGLAYTPPLLYDECRELCISTSQGTANRSLAGAVIIWTHLNTLALRTLQAYLWIVCPQDQKSRPWQGGFSIWVVVYSRFGPQ